MSGYGVTCDSCYEQLDVENNAFNEDGTPHVCTCLGDYMAARRDVETISYVTCIFSPPKNPCKEIVCAMPKRLIERASNEIKNAIMRSCDGLDTDDYVAVLEEIEGEIEARLGAAKEDLKRKAAK